MEWHTLDSDFLAWHLRTALTEEFVADLFQLRQWVEPQAAFAAAQSADPAALARIADAYADMERFQTGSGDLIGADLRFHQAILDATDNIFVGVLGGLIHTALVALFSLGWRGVVIKDERLHQHRAVLQAIKAREPESARRCMATLLQDSSTTSAARWAGTRGECSRALEGLKPPAADDSVEAPSRGKAMPTYEECAISIVMHVVDPIRGLTRASKADVHLIISRGAAGCPARGRA